VLYCVALAAIEDCGEQVVISELADRVTGLAASRTDIPGYDSTQRAERRDLVAAVRLLVEHGALIPTRDQSSTERDERGYLSGDGNAIYDVDHRAAAVLLAAPVPPTRADTPSGLTRPPASNSEDGENRRRRHAIMRRLVDDPVLYITDLSEDELAYYRSQRPALIRELKNMLDVRVEVRAEGAAVLDDELTDRPFPKERTAQFAALLLAQRFAAASTSDDAEKATISAERVTEMCVEVADLVSRQVKTIGQRPVSTEAVSSVALKMLIELRMVELIGNDVRPLPVIARYRNTSHRQDSLPILRLPSQRGIVDESENGV
jgi:uncharacterized protein (TIGR02678 family)